MVVAKNKISGIFHIKDGEMIKNIENIIDKNLQKYENSYEEVIFIDISQRPNYKVRQKLIEMYKQAGWKINFQEIFSNIGYSSTEIIIRHKRWWHLF